MFQLQQSVGLATAKAVVPRLRMLKLQTMQTAHCITHIGAVARLESKTLSLAEEGTALPQL